MRHRALRGSRALVVAFVIAASAAACGDAPASVAPATPRPTPLITPDPHLGDPTTADAVFQALAKAGLRVSPNNADAGASDGPLVKRINATLLGWPFTVSQFKTSASLTKLTDWGKAGEPAQGDPPIAIAGLNILVEWGPTTGDLPPQPDAAKLSALHDLATNLDLLLSPLRARSVVAVPNAGAVAQASAEPQVDPETTPEP
jgi:hypothetical protein